MLDAPCSALAQCCCSSILCGILSLFVQCYCPFVLVPRSLFDIIVHPILVQRCCSSHPCSTFLFLLSLLDAIVLHSLFNGVVLSLLSRRCCSSCPYSTLLFLHSLLNTIVVLCLLNVAPPFFLLDTTPLLLAWHYCPLLLAPPFSLLDVVVFVLFVWLYYSSILARHCNSCAPCSMLQFLHSLFIFNIACSHSSTSLLHRGVATLLFLFLCSMLMLLYSLFNVVVLPFLVSNWYFPLMFL